MMYPVMECFYSVQGEGAHAGTPAYFIRLGGCDVGCVWCDVKESWDADAHPRSSVDELVQGVRATAAQVVVLTGGEPAMYDLTPLTTALRKEGYKIHIETSGVYTLQGDFDWITFSPKKFKAPLKAVAAVADELKVIVFNRSDLEWALAHSRDCSAECQLYLQAEWEKREKMYPLIFDFIRERPQWKISVQTHKYMGVD